MVELEKLKQLALIAQKRFGYFKATPAEEVKLNSGRKYWSWDLNYSHDPSFPIDETYDLGEHTVDGELAEYIGALSPEKVLELIALAERKNY